MIELLANIKKLDGSELSFKGPNNKLYSFKEVGIPENQLSNLDKSLDKNKVFTFNDAGVSKEVVPLNYNEESFNKLLSNGKFDNAQNKIYVVNQEFYKQPLDIVNKIQSTVKSSGGEIKSFNFRDEPKTFLEQRSLVVGNDAYKSNYGKFSDVAKEAPNQVGVYIAYLDGNPAYVGRAIEERPDQATFGLRKRLQEHFRGSSTGKSELFANRDNLNFEIIPCQSVQEAKQLEGLLIEKYNMVENGWNKRNESTLTS